MRPRCAHTRGPRFQRGRRVISHGGHGFTEAPVRSRTGAKISMRPQCAPVQGPWLQRGRTALTHWGHDFKEALVRSRMGAISTKGP